MTTEAKDLCARTCRFLNGGTGHVYCWSLYPRLHLFRQPTRQIDPGGTCVLDLRSEGHRTAPIDPSVGAWFQWFRGRLAGRSSA